MAVDPNAIDKVREWWNAFTATFPGAEFVDYDRNTGSFTVSLSFQDIFALYYNTLKRNHPTLKVALKPCDLDKKYGMCIIINASHKLGGWHQYGFEPDEKQVDNVYIYRIPFEQVWRHFQALMRTINSNKPLTFKFQARRNHNTGEIRFYITFIPVNVVMKNGYK